jgi:hypothetical protein
VTYGHETAVAIARYGTRAGGGPGYFAVVVQLTGNGRQPVSRWPIVGRDPRPPPHVQEVSSLTIEAAFQLILSIFPSLSGPCCVIKPDYLPGHGLRIFRPLVIATIILLFVNLPCAPSRDQGVRTIQFYLQICFDPRRALPLSRLFWSWWAERVGRRAAAVRTTLGKGLKRS